MLVLGDGIRLDDGQGAFGHDPLPFREQRDHRRAHLGRARGDAHAGGFEGGDLVGGRAAAAGDDGAGVSHAPARRRRLAGDEGDHRLGHVLADELGRLLLRGAADLADHDDARRCPGSSWNSRSASTKLVPLIGSPPMPTQVDCPMPELRELMHGLVGQRAAARHDADACPGLWM